MKRLLAFSFYDVGNSVFPMIVVSALTSSYFVNQVADNPQTGTALWQLTIGIAGILIALLMPYRNFSRWCKKWQIDFASFFYCYLYSFNCSILVYPSLIKLHHSCSSNFSDWEHEL